MNRSKVLFGVIFICAVLAAGGPALAKLVVANLGLAEGPASCDGPGTFTYTATWNNPSKATSFAVQTGDQCKLGATVCGISSKSCVASCKPGGACSASMSKCLIGKGAAWVRVVSGDGTVYQQIKAGPPSRCP